MSNYEIFISYSRRDNKSPDDASEQPGWVTALCEHILMDHRRFSTEPLRIFFDKHAINDMDDWRHRILGGLRASKILLVCLSPNYFRSEYCRWEWEEYLRRQVHQLMGHESITPVYFVEVPGSDEQQNAVEFDRWVKSIEPWKNDLLRSNFTDIRPWFPTGARAMQEAEVQRRFAKLGESLWERLQRARRASAVPGNLRWQNPHFVGRREELRKLHEQLCLGTIGVVSAVHGLGGQGKTELAVAYAHAWADCYPAGLWSLAAEGHRELLPLIGNLAWERSLGFTPTEAEKNDPVLLGRGVLAELQRRSTACRMDAPVRPDQVSDRQRFGEEEADGRRRPCYDGAVLILLDNVSEPDLLTPAQLATLPGGMGAGWLRIIATTRLEVQEQKGRMAVLPVDALDEESALSLIRDHQPPRQRSRHAPHDEPNGTDDHDPQGTPDFASAAEEAAAREIVRALGCFTLAVEQVALYLGLHPEVSPSSFLQTLRNRGLPVTDELTRRDPDVAAQMLTQSKQLGLILDATLARLAGPARTALQFAALLPPDSVPWPWLRELTVSRHPELGERDDLGADPWLAVRRRLEGLRLLTGGDQPEIARIHRLVGAHVLDRLELNETNVAKEESLTSERKLVTKFVGQRGWHVYQSPESPRNWELDALAMTMPMLADHAPSSETLRDVTSAMMGVAEKLVVYRSTVTALAVLNDARTTLQRLAESDPANAAWQPDLSVSFEKVGNLATAQGNLPEAQRLFGESLRIRQRLAESDPANAAWQPDLSVSFEKLGNLATAQGNLPEAQRLFGESLCIRQRLAESDPANAAWQRDLSVSFIKLGDLATAQGNLPEAQRLFGESLRIAQRLAESDPANAEWQRDLSVSFEKVGNLATAQGNLPEAQRLFGESLRIRQRLAESDPANAAWQRDLSVSFEKLGNLATAQGNLPEAQRLFGESLCIRQRLAESDPANAEWQRDLFISSSKFGDIAVATGDLSKAEAAYRQVLAINQRLAESDPANAEWQRDLSVSFEKLGDLAKAQGNLPEAQRLFGEDLRIARRLAESDPANAEWQRDLSVSFNKLGDLATAQGNLPEAQRLFGESLRIRERLAESDPANAAWQRDLSVSFIKLGDLATAQGNLPEAQRLFGESLRIAQRLAESDPANAEWQRDLSVSFEKLGNLATAQGNLPEAQRLFGESLRIAQRLAESDPANSQWQFDLGISNERLGDVASAQGDLAKAHTHYSAKRDVIQRLAESDPANAAWQRDLSVSFNKLGEMATAQGNLPEAQRLFGESLRIAQRLAESDPANAAWQRDLACSYQRIANASESSSVANEYLERCLQTLEHMRDSGMHLDPDTLRFYQQLAERIGKSSSPIFAFDGSRGSSIGSPVLPSRSSQDSRLDELALTRLRKDDVPGAMNLLRQQLFPHDSIIMNQKTDLRIRIVFLKALMLDNNVEGLRKYLPSIPEQDHPEIRKIATAFERWTKSRSLTQRLGLWPSPKLPKPDLFSTS